MATRKKFRFMYRGMISVEDLWDLPVQALDEIYKKLNNEAKSLEEESLLNKKTDENESLMAQIEIVKYIVSVKLEEKKAAETAKERADMRQRILEIKANRENKKLEELSDEDLNKMLDDLK